MKPHPNKCLVLNSGGLDSLVMLADMVERFGYKNTVSLQIPYYSMPEEDLIASERISRYYGVMHYIETVSMFKWPTPNKVIPGRNFVLFSIAASYCDSLGIPNIGLAWDGVYKKNYLYSKVPDAHQPFVNKLCAAFDEQSELAWKYGISLRAYTFCNMSKEQIVERGIELNAPFELSRSCHANQRDNCGKCQKCKQRAKLNVPQYNPNFVLKGHIDDQRRRYL